MARALLVVNPASDHGRTARRWPAIAAEARMRGLEVRERLTEGPGHATTVVREALRAGEELVVAVGGDGTVNEVVNGFADEDGVPLGAPAALGVVERGTGCDFIRTHGIPKGSRDAVRLLVEGRRRTIDLGRTATGDDASGVRLFANVASCGMTGDVADRANRTTKRFGGTASFLWATVAAFAAWRNVAFRIEADGRRLDRVANNVVCANGRYFGGGILIAPDAEPDDGLLDVVIVGDVGKADLARNVHRLYRGTLGRHPRVEVLRARRVVAEPERPLLVEVDGELPGRTPVTFESLPGALRLVVP